MSFNFKERRGDKLREVDAFTRRRRIRLFLSSKWPSSRLDDTGCDCIEMSSATEFGEFSLIDFNERIFGDRLREVDDPVRRLDLLVFKLFLHSSAAALALLGTS